MPDTPTPEQWLKIEDQLYAGRKIEAIKLLRSATGEGLAESKDIIDLHEIELREQFPHRFTKPKKKAGCVSILIYFFLAAALWNVIRTALRIAT